MVDRVRNAHSTNYCLPAAIRCLLQSIGVCFKYGAAANDVERTWLACINEQRVPAKCIMHSAMCTCTEIRCCEARQEWQAANGMDGC